MPHRLMLSSMLRIVSVAHEPSALYSRADVLHPIRVMTALKSYDEELNCIALGHELLNKTSVTVDDLVIAGMSDRVIRGIILFKDAPTPAQTLDNISSTYDTIRVAMPCLLDRGALADTANVSSLTAKKIEAYHRAYMRMAGLVNGAEHCKLLGLQHPFF